MTFPLATVSKFWFSYSTDVRVKASYKKASYNMQKIMVKASVRIAERGICFLLTTTPIFTLFSSRLKSDALDNSLRKIWFRDASGLKMHSF